MIWFVQLAKKYHPDHNKDEQASAKFTEIGEAYEVNLLLYGRFHYYDNRY